MVYGIVGIAVCVNTTIHRFGGLAYIEAGRNASTFLLQKGY